MSREEVTEFFQEYVFGFMFSDIQRGVDLAKSGRNAGNFLAALGLLCYTEVMGSIMQANFPPNQTVNAKNNFNAFFETLGPCYRSLAQSIKVYDVFRCGMAHEYLVKKTYDIGMVIKGPEPCGVWQNSNGHYSFVVERYFVDFAKACRTLHQKLMALPHPVLRN